MVWPESGIARVRSLNDVSFTEVRLLGSPEKLHWKKESGTVEIQLPKTELEKLGYALEITL
jgi:hypothetical protein